ncbi:MAG: sigma-70 family RNA polymerase sigma factor [bacterium]|nr:sigma-70 family RNA polymerase sigma factor [bacterium]
MEATLLWKSAYEEHGPAILAFLRSRIHDTSDAEDLLQETFVAAIRSGNPLRDASRVKSYLFQIAANLMKSHYRRTRPVAVSTLGEGGEMQYESMAESAPSPEEHASHQMLQDRIATVMREMSPSHRKAFELGILQQMSYAEIADNTGWSPAQVKINVYRARKQAIAALAE